MKPSKVFYAMLIAACAACFGAGYSLKKVTTVFVDIPKTETDTLYGVSYYMPPADWFDLDFDPAPLPTIQVTKYIETGRHWYNNPYFTLGAGVLAGVAVTQITK